MLLKGKKGLIIGVANKHSIAWAIAQSTAGQGAQLHLQLSERTAEAKRGGPCCHLARRESISLRCEQRW